MKKHLIELIRYAVFTFKEIKLSRLDRREASKHSDWVELNTDEKVGIRKSDYPAIKMFKNIVGYSRDYISDAYYQSVLLPKLNEDNYHFLGLVHQSGYYPDKNYQDLFLFDLIKPTNNIVRNVAGKFFDQTFSEISEYEVETILNKYEVLVFKISVDGSQGRGVQKVIQSDFKKALYSWGCDYVIQEVVKQHEFLSYFNESSVNVIRLTTIIVDGNVELLAGILRIGPTQAAFCDHVVFNSMSPLVIGISEDGTLNKVALDTKTLEIHDTVFGKTICGKIPQYEKMKDNVMNIHRKLPKCKIIGWDLTLNKDEEIVCIEYNTRCPGIVQSQLVNGPIFGKLSKNGMTFKENIVSS